VPTKVFFLILAILYYPPSSPVTCGHVDKSHSEQKESPSVGVPCGAAPLIGQFHQKELDTVILDGFPDFFDELPLSPIKALLAKDVKPLERSLIRTFFMLNLDFHDRSPPNLRDYYFSPLVIYWDDS
jgi:hypothetical protein